MPNLKGITNTIIEILAEAAFQVNIAFSRKSFYEKSILMEFGCKSWQINRGLKIMEKGRYLTNKNGRFYLTKRGKQKINLYKLEKIDLTSRGNWDRKWRLIIFDIPEKIRVVRNILRNKLREWNCYKIQHSVFVYPYSCEKEIAEAVKILNADSWVYVFVANTLGAIEEKVKKHYRL